MYMFKGQDFVIAECLIRDSVTLMPRENSLLGVDGVPCFASREFAAENGGIPGIIGGADLRE